MGFSLSSIFDTFYLLSWKEMVMIAIGLVLIYLAIVREYEPTLLLPIGFGCILANLGMSSYQTFESTEIINGQLETITKSGFMKVLYDAGISTELFPLLVFIAVGAMIDFTPLFQTPVTMIFGLMAQAGIFLTMGLAYATGFFDLREAASIGIIGAADGPTSIYVANRFAPQLLGSISVAAYSYMALVPIIQPPVMQLLTSKKEREVIMEQAREVTKFERIVFPVVCTIVISLLLPPVASLVGMLMLGNLFRESGVTDRLSDTAQNALINIVTIFLATGTGLTMEADSFLNVKTILIIGLGLVAFIGGTAVGVIFGKIMYLVTGDKVNPLIGSAGVSAVPMAARVSQMVVQKSAPQRRLIGSRLLAVRRCAPRPARC